MLEQLRVAQYQFTVEALEELRLPPYEGATLRGGFGHALRKLTCLHQDRHHCAGCGHHQDCAYGYIFETAPPPDAQVLGNLEALPLPFVIRPPQDQRPIIPPGGHFQFGLVLVGRAMVYLPYFILAFRELGRMGLGSSRAKYVLQRVLAQHPWNGGDEILFDGVDVRVCQDRWSVDYHAVVEQARKLPSDQLTLHFLTPTRLKYGGEYVEQPPFHVLLRSILRRVSSLSYFHCGQQWEFDYRGAIERAQGVEARHMATKWVDWSRYSRRQGQRMNLGGFVGEVSYRGDLAQFGPLLLLGQLVHVGKATVFGHGWYELLDQEA